MHDYATLERALQETLAHEIPITVPIGIKVAQYDGQCLMLFAPLAPNINHKSTAFAGSLNSIVTLTGWGLTWILLRELDISATIVIQDSACQYLKPVTRDFVATCCKPVEFTQFVRMLREKGRARIELSAEIRENERVAVAFQGRYVVRRCNERSKNDMVV